MSDNSGSAIETIVLFFIGLILFGIGLLIPLPNEWIPFNILCIFGGLILIGVCVVLLLMKR